MIRANGDARTNRLADFFMNGAFNYEIYEHLFICFYATHKKCAPYNFNF